MTSTSHRLLRLQNQLRQSLGGKWTSASMSRSLSGYLEESKRKLERGDAAHLVTGNEAGDLDSIASAIAYGYMQTFLGSKSGETTPWLVPVTQTSRRDLHLRPENTYAFAVSGIDPSSLACLEDFWLVLREDKSVKLTLVDHNKLSVNLACSPDADEARVEGIIDHHADEELYRNISPRVIRPCGSCSSLVVSYFKQAWAEAERQSGTKEEVVPRSLATLLMAAIMIDTANLENKSKVTDIDIEAMQWLQYRSTFSVAPEDRSQIFGAQSIGRTSEETLKHPPTPGAFSAQLKMEKGAIHNLETDELLRRDYKEFVSGTGYRAGLASVPWDLVSWFKRDLKTGTTGSETCPPASFLDGLASFSSQHELQLLGIGTSFKDDSGSKGDKHRRELFLYTSHHADNASPLPLNDCDHGTGFASLLEEDGKEILRLRLVSEGKTVNGQWRYYQQQNAASTRKQLAPLVKSTLEKFGQTRP